MIFATKYKRNVINRASTSSARLRSNFSKDACLIVGGPDPFRHFVERIARRNKALILIGHSHIVSTAASVLQIVAVSEEELNLFSCCMVRDPGRLIFLSAVLVVVVPLDKNNLTLVANAVGGASVCALWSKQLDETLASTIRSLHCKFLASQKTTSILRTAMIGNDLQEKWIADVVSEFKQGGNTTTKLIERTQERICAIFSQIESDEAMMKAFQFFVRFLIERSGIKGLDLAGVIRDVALLQMEAGKEAAAIRSLKVCLAVKQYFHGEASKDAAEILSLIGVLHLNREDYNHALQSFAEALRIERIVLGSEHLDVAVTSATIGRIYHAQGCLREALGAYVDAFLSMERSLGGRHPYVVDLRGIIIGIMAIEDTVTDPSEHITDPSETELTRRNSIVSSEPKVFANASAADNSSRRGWCCGAGAA